MGSFVSTLRALFTPRSSTAHPKPSSPPSTVFALPPELLDLVFTEVRLSCGDDDEAVKRNGKAFALVCKAWHPAGVALVWHRLELFSPADVVRASLHASAFPRVPLAIRDMHICGKRRFVCLPAPGFGETSNEAAPAAEDAETASALCSLWSTCAGLQTLSVRCIDWISLPVLFRHIPLVQTLAEVRFQTVQQPPPPLEELFSHLETLPYFTTAFVECGIVVPFEAASSFAYQLPLQQLQLAIIQPVLASYTNTGTASFLAHVSPCTLRHLTLLLSDIEVVARLIEFVHLDHLHVHLPDDERACEIVEGILTAAGNYLEPFTLIIQSMSSSPAELRLWGSSSLSTFLKAVPPMLKVFLIADLYFTWTDEGEGAFSVEGTPGWPAARGGCCVKLGVTKGVQEILCLKVSPKQWRIKCY